MASVSMIFPKIDWPKNRQVAERQR